VVIVLAVLLSPSVGGRRMVDPMFSRPEHLPGYWTAALAAADAGAGDGRMLEIPGIRFAAYRWGTTYEPVTAGNAKTPSAWREQIPYGGPGSADMLVALDNRIQEGLLDPAALAPMARLLGVSELLVRNDLEYERYDNIAPDRVWKLLAHQAPGLGQPVGFGPVGVNRPDPAHRRDDEPKPDDPNATYPALGLVPVQRSTGLVQLVPVSQTVVLDGDAEGIVDAAAAGVIDGRSPVLEAAATIGHPSLLDDVLGQGASIVLTDTNRRRVRRWRSIKNTGGITLRADQDPSAEDGRDGGEAPLDVFPGAGSDWQTVAAPTGAKLSATRFGNPLWFEAGLRPAAALDGDRDTGWQAGPFIGGIGDRLTVELDAPLHTDHLSLSGSRGTTHLRAVNVRLDGGRPTRVVLDDRSRQPGGQTVRFPARTFSTVSFELAATEPASAGVEPGSFGIDEIGLERAGGPVVVDEAVRLPVALTSRLGASSARNPLSIVLTRLRGDTTDPRLFGEERTLTRLVSLPTDRTFGVAGEARRASGSTVPIAGGCRDDLLKVDGVPVSVRLTEGSNGVATLAACAPLRLTAGAHQLRTMSGRDVDVDRLVLSSGGAPASPVTKAPHWKQRSKTEISVTAEGASGPSWLLLAQSRNDGWKLSAPHGMTVSDPVLLNGFANGWYLPAPATTGGTYRLRWAPQRWMDAALIVSLAAALATLVLAARGRRWHPAALVGGEAPELDPPWRDQALPSARRTALTALGTGVVAAAVIQPWWGLAAAVLVMVAGRWRRGRGLLAGATVLVLATSVAIVLVERAGERDQDPFTFFTALRTPHRVAVFAVTLLAAELLLRRSAWRRD
jgi:hypothetical protein